MKRLPLPVVALGIPPLFAGLCVLLVIVMSSFLGRPIAQSQLIFGFIVGWILWQAGIVIFIIQARALRRRD